MKKNYRIIVLIIILVLLSTYTTSELNFQYKKSNNFFKIKNIDVVNNHIIIKSEILEKLNNIYDRNIFILSKKDIENPLSGIEFLKKIEVKKKYPNSIVVKIYETSPVGILFKKEKKYLLDSSSNLISYRKDLDLNKLPAIFGKSAELYFVDFFSKLKKNNFPYHRIKNYYYHQIGRWDLQLLDDKLIKLPDDKIIKAIRKSNELLNRKDFENYSVFDLRIDDKIIVE